MEPTESCVCTSVFKTEDIEERKQLFTQKWIDLINFLERSKANIG